MDKKDYIVNQLRRTFNKKYENYCITRIYHLLNRNDIQIITQQMFRRNDGKIALADLYFPQLNLSVEVDEGHHKFQTDADDKRGHEIIENKSIKDQKLIALGEVIYDYFDEERIDVTTSIEDINSRIDEIILLIKKRILELGERFKPWECCDKKPEDYIKLGKIECRDNVSLRTLKEVSDLFNKGYKVGSREHFFKTNVENERVWCLKLKLEDTDFKGNKYQNEISIDGKYIYETEENNDEFYTYDRKNEVRIVFPKYRDETGSWRYKFKGIYTFNRELSDKTKKAVWEKVGEYIDLKQYFN